jgi:hypothetical protein
MDALADVLHTYGHNLILAPTQEPGFLDLGAQKRAID